VAASKTPVRRDPPRRSAEERGKFGILNKDPNRAYAWAYADDHDTGRAHYESMGYDVEVYRADGPRPAVGRTDRGAEGTEITSSGHVLMSVSRERAQEIYMYGPDGDSGQVDADRIERAMMSRLGREGVFKHSIMGHKNPGSGLRYASAADDFS
jgi:hypothetical protein